MTKLELLQKFCAKDTDIREYLRTPLRVGEYIYATNGHVAVRMRGDEVVPDGEKIQSIGKIFSQAESYQQRHIEFPALPDPIKCKHCGGSGSVYEVDCEDCDGRGYHEIGNHDYSCKECDGSGAVNIFGGDAQYKKLCSDCGGSGYKKWQRVPVENSGFDRQYLALLQELPGMKLRYVNGDDMAYFVFDGGDGVLMPCRE